MEIFVNKSDDGEGLRIIHRVIAGLSDKDRRQVEAVAGAIRILVTGHGTYGDLALALVGAEKAAGISHQSICTPGV